MNEIGEVWKSMIKFCKLGVRGKETDGVRQKKSRGKRKCRNNEKEKNENRKKEKMKIGKIRGN